MTSEQPGWRNAGRLCLDCVGGRKTDGILANSRLCCTFGSISPPGGLLDVCRTVMRLVLGHHDKGGGERGVFDLA